MRETCQAICSVDLPTGNEVSIVRRRFVGGDGPSVALVAGLRGDAPSGIRVLHDVTRLLRALPDLAGTVDVYPCANPVASHAGSRTWPFFDIDLGRLFPGRPDGHPPDRVAHALASHLRDAAVVVEVDDGGAEERACLHARVRRGRATETDLAVRIGVPVVWERSPGPALAGTLAGLLDVLIGLCGGAGRRLDEPTDAQLARTLLALLAAVGVLGPEHAAPAGAPCLRVGDPDVLTVRASAGGLFLARCEPGMAVASGQELGVVVDPIAAEEVERPVAPRAGRILAVREQPVVYPGSTVARVVAT